MRLLRRVLLLVELSWVIEMFWILVVMHEDSELEEAMTCNLQ
jgi:hypothetical protein